jgi:hypothetical protein
VQNAIKVYDDFAGWNALEQASFIKTHVMLMDGLIPKPGQLRTSSVGITKGMRLRVLRNTGSGNDRYVNTVACLCR